MPKKEKPMAKEQKHRSFSQLNMFLRCGEQFRRRYIEGEIIAPAARLIRGRCCHTAERNNFEYKITTKEYLPTEAVVDKYVDEWNANEYQIGWTEEELDGENPKKAAGRVKDSGVRLIKVFNQQQLVNCDPVAVEDEFTVQFEGGYLPLLGYIDRVDTDDVVGEEKFVAKSPSKGDIETDVQMTSYDLGYRAKYGRPPKQLKKHWAVDTKTPKTVIQTCPPRQPEVIDRFLCRLEAFMGALEKGIFLPADNNAWWCSPKWCGYYSTCKYRK